MIPVWLLRYLPQIGIGIVILVALVWFGHSRHEAGLVQGRAEIQALWDADRAKAEKAFNEAKAKAEKVELEQARKAQEIQDGLQAKLDAATHDAGSLADRLRRYQQSRPGRCSVSQAPGAAPVADSAPGESARDGEIEAATSAVMEACSRDAERLKGWQDWWASVSR